MEKQINVEYVEGNIESFNYPVLSLHYRDRIASKQYHHYHHRHELVIFWTQSVQIFCEDTIIRSSGYNAFFSPAFQEHYQMNHPSGLYKRFLIQFPVDFLEAELVDQNLNEFFYCSLKPEQMETIQPYIHLILKSYGTPEDSKWSKKEQKYLLVLLFNELSRCVKKSSDTNIVLNKDRVVFRVCAYIHQHYHEKITLDGLSEMHFISRAALTKRFREATGNSITEYIRQIRINYAIQYLVNGYSVNETAEKCGFYDAAYFIRVFRKITGKNPKEYKKT